MPDETEAGLLCFLSEKEDEANEKNVASDKNKPIRDYTKKK